VWTKLSDLTQDIQTGSYITIGGKTLKEGQETDIKDGDEVFASMKWSIPNNTGDIRTGDAFYYDFPAGIVFKAEDSKGAIFDGSDEVGTYEITSINDGAKAQHSRIVFTYTDSNFVKKSNITGNFNMNGTLQASALDTDKNGKTTINFPGIVTCKLKVIETGSLTVAKTYVNTEEQTGWFLVTVTSSGINRNVVVTDTMGRDLSLTDGSMKVYSEDPVKSDGSGFKTGAAEYDKDDYTVSSDNNGFTLKLNDNVKMTDKEAIYLLYRTKLSDDGYFESTEDNLKNTATAISDQMTEKAQAQAQYTIGDGEAAVVKTGTANTTDGTVTWKIRVNMHNQTTVVLKESLKEIAGINIIKDDTVNVSEKVGTSEKTYETTFGELLNGYELTATEKNTVYTLTYTTKVILENYDVLNGMTCINTVDADFGTWKKSATATVSYGKNYESGQPRVIRKSCELNGSDIDWKIFVQVPEKVEGVDSLLAIEDGYTTAYSNMAEGTDSKINPLGDFRNLVVKIRDGQELVKGTDYVLTDQYSDKLSKPTTPLFRIELTTAGLSKVMGKYVVVTYSTKCDNGGMTANVDYVNHAVAWFSKNESREATSTYTNNSAVITKSGTGSDNSGLMSWDIQATTSVEKGSTIEDSWTDKSPMKLVKGSFKIKGTTLPESSFVTVNADGNGFSIDLDQLQQAAQNAGISLSGAYSINYKTRHRPFRPTRARPQRRQRQRPPQRRPVTQRRLQIQQHRQVPHRQYLV
jgi:hypothetical protein